MVEFIFYTINNFDCFYRLASCGSDKMIKLWGREGDDKQSALRLDMIKQKKISFIE
jgi:hypothetical protein